MLSTYQGYIANGTFVLSEHIKKLPERKKAILTILNEENFEDENNIDAPDWAKKQGLLFRIFSKMLIRQLNVSVRKKEQSLYDIV